MYRKCFFKNKGVLSRRFVASGLAAVFSAGMFGSYAGAMSNSVHVINQNLNKKLLDNDLYKKDSKKLKKRHNSVYLSSEKIAAESFVKDVVGEKTVHDFLSKILKSTESAPIVLLFFRLELRELFIQFLTELTLEYFYAGKMKSRWETFSKFTTSFNNNNDMMKEIFGNFFDSDKKIINKYIKKVDEYKQEIANKYNDNNNNNKNILDNSIDDNNIPNVPLNNNIDSNSKDSKKWEKRRNSIGLSLESLEEIAAKSFVENVVGEKTVHGFLSKILKSTECAPILLLFYRSELRELFIQFLTELTLEYFYAGKMKSRWETFSKFTTSFNNNNDMMKEVFGNFFKSDKKEKIMERYKKTAKNFIKPEQKTFDEYNDNDIIINNNVQNQNNIQNLNRKNKLFSNWKLIVSLIGVGFVVFIVIILSVKGKSNTDNNKDDEKVNPPIDPENPLTDPKSDDENLEQKKQEQGSQEQKSSIGLEILKGAGTAAAGGTLSGGGTYLVNEVLKRGKSSEVKNSRNVDDKYMYLDSDGKEVIKTEEGRKDNYDNDDKNADNSGTKQLLEDKDAEEKEEGQEEILESSALSDDTEATSDEDKNKD